MKQRELQASAGPSNVIDMAARRAARSRNEQAKPAWGDDILTLAAYARMVRAEHHAEQARIDFERRRDGITDKWWEGPEDIKQRIEANNREWDLYIGLLRYLAKLPATTRAEATVKRTTIGKQWLAADVTCPNLFGPMREGCIADDHLFPPSLKLVRN